MNKTFFGPHKAAELRSNGLWDSRTMTVDKAEASLQAAPASLPAVAAQPLDDAAPMKPVVASSIIVGPTAQSKSVEVPPQADAAASLAFLDDFFDDAQRQLTALKKVSINGKKKANIHVGTFAATDRNGQRAFILEWNSRGYDIYFAPNPLKGSMTKKAAKADVAEACWLWIDLDPRVKAELKQEREAMLAFLTTNLPDDIPKPNRVVDSGRGFWGFWKLAVPHAVDGDGPATQFVESYGKGIERAYGDRFADGCRNIDRIARLPGTINHKTGALARVLAEFSHEERYAIEDFPRFLDESALQDDEIGAVTSVDEALTKVSDEIRDMILTGEPNQSGHDMKVACALVAAGCGDKIIEDIFQTYPNDEKGNLSRITRLIKRARQRHAEHQDPDLAAMNAKHCVLSIGGKTRVMTLRDSRLFPGQKGASFSTFEDFKNLHDNKSKRVKVRNKTGQLADKHIPLGDWWLGHMDRRQYDGGREFMPEIDEAVVGDKLNTWQGFSVEPSRKGNWGKFRKHIFHNLCTGNKEHFKYLIRLMATIVQTRKRTEIAVLLRSKQEGTGKGFFAKHFGMLFGPHYMQLAKADHVLGKHNEHLETLLLLNADEALFAGDPRHRNALYNLVTESKHTIEPKFVGAYPAANYVNLIITTNADHAIPVGPTARRFFALNVASTQMQNFEYFDEIENQLKAGGYNRMLYDLQRLDLTGFDVRKVPKTAALLEQAALSRDGIDALVETIAHAAWLPYQHHLHPNVASTKGTKHGEGFWNWARENFPKLRYESPLAMARALEPWGCKTWDSNGPHIRFSVDINQLRDAFDKKHGVQDWSGDPNQWVKAEPDVPF